MIDTGFWRGKTVLLTGHTGFKGSWLALWLQSLGADVVGYALEPEGAANLFETARVGEGMTSVIGDVRDIGAVQDVFARHRPAIVIHMAAQALVRRSYANPVETYAVNVLGTAHVLEAVRHAGTVRAVVNVTSDKCYENRELPAGYRETDPMGGYDPYSSSKGCAEILTASYRQSFFNPGDFSAHRTAVATARAGNVIGGGDWADDRLVPDLLRAMTAGRPAVIRYPDAVRPWQHVLEPLSGYLLLAQKLWEQGPAFGDAWNFGPDDAGSKPVSWVADRLTQLWGESATWTRDGNDHPHETRTLALDCSKAKSQLGWRPRWGLEKALQETVNWHRAASAGAEDMRQVTLRQIAGYQNGRG